MVFSKEGGEDAIVDLRGFVRNNGEGGGVDGSEEVGENKREDVGVDGSENNGEDVGVDGSKEGGEYDGLDLPGFVNISVDFKTEKS